MRRIIISILLLTFLGILILFIYKSDTNKEPKISPTIQSNYETFSYRKYDHVSRFYEKLSVNATEVCMKNNIPPAALLAIAGLESGWNKGYISRITGNILSLGAKKSDIELPSLTLTRLIETNELLFDSLEILKYNTNDITWEIRPSSLKKDYRPAKWAGTPYNLAYFKYHPDAKAQAHKKNMEEFVTTFISRDSRLKAYRDSRAQMDRLVKEYGKEILLEEQTAIDFVNGIGGKKYSYNYRKSWPKKVIQIMQRAGLVTLTSDIYKGKSFEESW